MSVRIMSEVFERSKTQGNARLVLLSLADTCSDEGVCFPSIKTIAKKANISEETTRKFLHAFEKIGLVEAEERFSPVGRRTSNTYKLNLNKVGDDELTKDVIYLAIPKSKHRTSDGMNQFTPSPPDPVHTTHPLNQFIPSIMNHHKEPKIEPSRESSAVASHSSEVVTQPNLFPTEITANAKVSFATAHFNDPPKMANAIRAGFKKNPPPRNIPTELDTPEFNTAWNEFLQHRKEKRAPMTPTAQKNMFGKFTAWGVESAVAAIDTAISNGWTGVFEPKENKSKSKPERFSNF
jgi:DNA-binding transcriptional regulator YhcF (GntR family)